MELNGTFYPNVSRTILGSGNLVFTNDVILDCDTTLNPVDLTLAEIPSGSWSTQYKLYIIDKGGNASVNNITINAPVGYTINDLPSLVINTNNGSAIIRISKDKGYLASLSTMTGGSTLEVLNQGVSITPSASKMDFVGILATLVAPNSVKITNAFISGTSAIISGLATAGSLIPNQWYNVTNAIYGYFNHPFNIYLPAITKSQLSSFGIGEFYNADYSGIGDYSGVVGFGTQFGVWRSTLAPALNDVCIWNNLHYKNITGANGVTDPSADVVNWQVLTYAKTNGYILEYNEINVDSSYRIIYRKDSLNNEVEWTDLTTTGSFDQFPFGNPQVVNNKVIEGSYWELCNTLITKDIRNNHLSNADVQFQTNNDPFLIGTFRSNNIFGTIRPLNWFKGGTALNVNQNLFAFCQGNSTLSDANISTNSFQICSLTLNLSGGASMFQNQLYSSSLALTKTHATFDNNSLFQASLSISNSAGFERSNFLNSSQCIITNNDGYFTNNRLFQSADLQISNISVSGLFNFNSLSNQTQLLITDVQSNLGNGGVKGLGNDFSNCKISINTFVGSMYGNQISGLEMQIKTFNGTIAQCNFFGTSTMTIDDMGNNTITFLMCQEFVLGSAGWNMYESYNGGTFQYGVANIQCTLDCSDPAIYDAINFELIIPNELRKWGGNFILSNANAIDITKISNTYDKAPIKMYNDFGATKFITTGVGVATGGDLIYTTPAPATFIINYRVDGSDFITLNRSGFLMAIVETSIFV